jgi:hypothetical protein
MGNVGKSTRGGLSAPLHFTRLFRKDEYYTSRRTRIDQTMMREERAYFGFEQDPNDDQQRHHLIITSLVTEFVLNVSDDCTYCDSLRAMLSRE